MEKINLIALTKAVILLGLFGALFIPLAPLMNMEDSFFSFFVGIFLIYAFYIFEKESLKENKK